MLLESNGEAHPGEGHELFDKPWSALLSTVNMMFGDTNVELFKSASSSPATAITLFIFFMVIIPTVMLNALIAIMVSAFFTFWGATICF